MQFGHTVRVTIPFSKSSRVFSAFLNSIIKCSAVLSKIHQKVAGILHFHYVKTAMSKNAESYIFGFLGGIYK